MTSLSANHFCRLLLVLGATSLLASCATNEPGSEERESEETYATVRILTEATVEGNHQPAVESLTLPDLLYAGLQALDADRLLTPEGSNAFDYFARALAIEKDSVIALEGIEAIVERYLALAREAIGNGSFDAAERMLGRARLVKPSAAGIALVQTELANERESGDLFFQLDGAGVSAQSDSARAELAGIARQARDCGAFFLITAPTDALARWMFMAMRESVPGYRLRGNIELSSQTGVRLRLPDSDQGCSD